MFMIMANDSTNIAAEMSVYNNTSKVCSGGVGQTFNWPLLWEEMLKERRGHNRQD